jgi:hypothetical protein
VQTRTHKYTLSKSYPWVQKLIFAIFPDRLFKCANFSLQWVSLCVSLPRYGPNETLCLLHAMYEMDIRNYGDLRHFLCLPVFHLRKQQRILINLSLSVLMAWTTCFNIKNPYFSCTVCTSALYDSEKTYYFHKHS